MGTLPVQSAGPVGTGQLVVPVTTAPPRGQSARDPQQPKSVGNYRKGGNDLKGTSSRCSTCPWFHICAQRCQTRRLRRWPVPRRSGPPSRRVRAVPAFGNYPKNKTGLPPGAEGEEAGGGPPLPFVHAFPLRTCGGHGASGSVGCRRVWGSGSVGCRRAWGAAERGVSERRWHLRPACRSRGEKWERRETAHPSHLACLCVPLTEKKKMFTERSAEDIV